VTALRWHCRVSSLRSGDAGFYGERQPRRPKWTRRLCHGHEAFSGLSRSTREQSAAFGQNGSGDAFFLDQKLSSRGGEGRMWPARQMRNFTLIAILGRNRPESTGAPASHSRAHLGWRISSVRIAEAATPRARALFFDRRCAKRNTTLCELDAAIGFSKPADAGQRGDGAFSHCGRNWRRARVCNGRVRAGAIESSREGQRRSRSW